MNGLPENRAGPEKNQTLQVNSEKLILFLKAPRPGAVKTRLAEAIGTGPACAAYLRCVETLLIQLQSLRPVELCFSPAAAAAEIQAWLRPGWIAVPQAEGDLGQRLRSAFQRSFDAGASRVVVIGSDCPAITADDIRNAWEALRTHDVVLGPANDGGYWLIGLRRIQPELFGDIPWSTGNVFAETLKRSLRGNLSVQVLRELRDIDTESDWIAFLQGSQCPPKP